MVTAKTRGMVWVLLSTLVVAMPVSRASAAGPTEFDYPELSVTPRASDRVDMEASQEAGRRWTTHLPVQVSALTTLAAGLVQLGNADPTKSGSEYSGWAGVTVGGAWLALTLWMGSEHQPYASAQKELAGMPRKSQREQLTRERIAEEKIRAAASLGRRLRWLSVGSNLAAGVYMMTKVQSNTLGQVLDGVAIGAALAPVLFGYHWQDVAEEQESYKKRIYAPVASAAFFAEPVTGRPAPGLALSLTF